MSQISKLLLWPWMESIDVDGPKNHEQPEIMHRAKVFEKSNEYKTKK